MDIGLPPEVISALIHAGPGPGSMLSAARAWTALGGELDAVAADCEAVLADLEQAWSGPSAQAMATAATRHIAWLRNAAASAEQAGALAAQAAGSFASTVATVTTPAEVAANRGQLASLVATNLLGQNFPAIAATEAQYLAMWTRNTTAMASYQDASTSAAAALPAPLFPVLDDIASDPLVLLTVASISQSSSFPLTLLSLFPQYEALQPLGVDEAGGLLDRYFRQPLEGAASTSAPAASTSSPAISASVVPAAVTSMGRAVPVGGLMAPASAVRLVSAATPLTSIDESGPVVTSAFIPPIPPGTRKAQRDRSDERGYGPPTSGTVMPRTPLGG